MRGQPEIMERKIMASEAKEAGTVKDLVWWKDGKLAFVVERGREREAYQWFERVEKIGDEIFFKALVSLASATEIV